MYSCFFAASFGCYFSTHFDSLFLRRWIIYNYYYCCCCCCCCTLCDFFHICNSWSSPKSVLEQVSLALRHFFHYGSGSHLCCDRNYINSFLNFCLLQFIFLGFFCYCSENSKIGVTSISIFIAISVPWQVAYISLVFFISHTFTLWSEWTVKSTSRQVLLLLLVKLYMVFWSRWMIRLYLKITKIFVSPHLQDRFCFC